MVVGRKQGAHVPQQAGSYLRVCPGGWKGVLILILVLVMEGEALGWEDEVGRNRNQLSPIDSVLPSLPRMLAALGGRGQYFVFN